MKAILISINPKWVAKILNGEKTLEIRKTFPKCDLPIDVYIYCTKGKPYIKECDHFRYVGDYEIANKGYYLNGKVVARFWCDKVARITNFPSGYETYVSGTFPNIKVMKEEELLKLSCLTKEELRNYLPCDKERTGCAIHISSLEIFDKPKDISEFRQWFDCEKCWCVDNQDCLMNKQCPKNKLTRAPQSWCYIEI